jgi:hypothetical protein
LNYCHNFQNNFYLGGLAEYVVKDLLKGHRVVRVGGGRYVRYRLVPLSPAPPTDSP